MKKGFLIIGLLALAIVLSGCIGGGYAPTIHEFREEKPVFTLTEPPYLVSFTGFIMGGKEGEYLVNLEPFYFKPSTMESSPKMPSSSGFKIALRKNGVVIIEESLAVNDCSVDFLSSLLGVADCFNGYFYHSMLGVPELPDELIIYVGDQEIYSKKAPFYQVSGFSIFKQELGENSKIMIEWSEPANLDYKLIALINQPPLETGKAIAHDLGSVDNPISLDPHWQLPIDFPADEDFQFDIQFEVYATDGFRTYTARSKVFRVEAGLQMFAKIYKPVDGETYYQNSVPLEASSYDPRPGKSSLSCGGCPKEGNTFLWVSSIDGNISNMRDSHCQYLTPGKHTITLIVKNEGGREVIDSVNMTVGPGPASEEETKRRQQLGQTCDG